MDFADLLREAGLDPRRTKLLRHDAHGLSAWLKGPDHFLSFASVQAAEVSPFARDPEHVAHFLAGPRLSSGGYAARFVGISRLHGRWPWDGRRLPRVWVHDYRLGEVPEEAADQSWTDHLEEERGRLEIDWGIAPRSWHQWAEGNPKPVIGWGPADDIVRWASAAGRSVHLGEEERDRIQREAESRDLARAIRSRPTEIDRGFEEVRQGLREIRPDQARFRAALLQRYGPVCGISGPILAEVLEAAHIVPFAERTPQRNRIGNGLLLRRDLHRLFDLGLIAIDPADRTVRLNAQLRSTPYAAFEGRSLQADCDFHCLQEHWRRSQT